MPKKFSEVLDEVMAALSLKWMGSSSEKTASKAERKRAVDNDDTRKTLESELQRPLTGKEVKFMTSRLFSERSLLSGIQDKELTRAALEDFYIQKEEPKSQKELDEVFALESYKNNHQQLCADLQKKYGSAPEMTDVSVEEYSSRKRSTGSNNLRESLGDRESGNDVFGDSQSGSEPTDIFEWYASKGGTNTNTIRGEDDDDDDEREFMKDDDEGEEIAAGYEEFVSSEFYKE